MDVHCAGLLESLATWKKMMHLGGTLQAIYRIHSKILNQEVCVLTIHKTKTWIINSWTFIYLFRLLILTTRSLLKEFLFCLDQRNCLFSCCCFKFRHYILAVFQLESASTFLQQLLAWFVTKCVWTETAWSFNLIKLLHLSLFSITYNLSHT